MVKLKEFVLSIVADDSLFKDEGMLWGISRKEILPAIIEEWLDGFPKNPEVCVEDQDDCYLYEGSFIGFLAIRRELFDEYFSDSDQFRKFSMRIQTEISDRLKEALQSL